MSFMSRLDDAKHTREKEYVLTPQKKVDRDYDGSPCSKLSTTRFEDKFADNNSINSSSSSSSSSSTRKAIVNIEAGAESKGSIVNSESVDTDSKSIDKSRECNRIGSYDGFSNVHDETDEDDDKRRESIIWKVSEYLFDLFDANCMDGYKKITAFEDKALEHFTDYAQDSSCNSSSSSTAKIREFTFLQQNLHKEFLDLFESLIADFLTSESYTVAQFYEEVEAFRIKKPKNKNTDSLESEANEIVDVIFHYCDFQQWASMMIDMANRRRKWQPVSALESAIQSMKKTSPKA